MTKIPLLQKMIMKSFSCLHQQTQTVCASQWLLLGYCQPVVRVYVYVSVFFPLLFHHSRGALMLPIQFPPMSEPLRTD